MASGEGIELSATAIENFADRLAAAVLAKRSAVCVGLDPRWQSLPLCLREGVDAADWPEVARCTQQYCCEVLDAVANLAPVVKPQAAFFEQLGPHGMQALAAVIDKARHLNMLVLMDAKRGDIGSTAEGYAEAYLGAASPWKCDALTINPYLGDDTLRPFFDRARITGAGLFVLVKTSNPGSSFLQDLPCPEGRVYDRVANVVEGMSQASLGQFGYGICGAVTGATYPEELAQLRQRMQSSWLLIPGYGAQGGGAAEVRSGFDARGLGAIVNSSRGILFAYGKPENAGLNWQNAVRDAAERMRIDLQFQPKASPVELS